MDHKFYVGQTVKYKGGNNDSFINPGSLGEIKRVSDDQVLAEWANPANTSTNSWYAYLNEIEPIQTETQKTTKGLRYNSDKLRWRNFPMFLMEPLIEVAQYGESKYSTFNFLKGQTILDSLDSLKRHLASFESPYEPDQDKESQINHLAHVAWNALVAVHMMKTRPDLDDRYKINEEELKAYAEEIQRRGR